MTGPGRTEAERRMAEQQKELGRELRNTREELRKWEDLFGRWPWAKDEQDRLRSIVNGLRSLESKDKSGRVAASIREEISRIRDKLGRLEDALLVLEKRG